VLGSKWTKCGAPHFVQLLLRPQFGPDEFPLVWLDLEGSMTVDVGRTLALQLVKVYSGKVLLFFSDKTKPELTKGTLMRQNSWSRRASGLPPFQGHSE
jgi:hypothetical protein